MVKGGFQGLDISGVDLTAQSPTLPGAYATCAGADGKPIRVQTADGQVECSVKKVSTNYVLAGITGDGKILSITIGSTDGITVVENTPPSESTVKGLGSRYSIGTTYTSENPYTIPEDGYVNMNYQASIEAGSNSTMHFAKSSGTFEPLLVIRSTGSNEYVTLFVKKGTKVYITNNVTRAACGFYPLVTE